MTDKEEIIINGKGCRKHDEKYNLVEGYCDYYYQEALNAERRKMTTNYEKIKNMTLEEMAIFLSKSSIGEDIYVNEVIPDRDYWEQWLQSESEV